MPVAGRGKTTNVIMEGSTVTKSYIGAPIRRREDVRFLTGKATFVDDVKVKNALHAAVLRSSHAHARIKGLDTSRALSIPGVVAVFTFEDIAPCALGIPMRLKPLPGFERFLQLPLAQNKVRYVGEPVAVAVAESRYLAEDALDVIEVTYEALPPVVDLWSALRDQNLIHEASGTNLASRYTISLGDIEGAFSHADYTRKEHFRVHRHTGNPLETRGIVASYDGGKGELTVWGPTKVTFFVREVLSRFMNISEHKIHIIEPDVGGGFGIRGEFYPEDFLIPFASVKLERPVKWIEDRREHLMTANHSRQVEFEIEIAAGRDGTFVGMRAWIYADMGAYIRPNGGVVPANSATFLRGPYDIPNFECHVHAVMTNKTGVGSFRAPGRYESAFARERLVDMVARDLNLDPVELRRKNLIRREQMPYSAGKLAPGEEPTVYDSGDFHATLNRALEESSYESLKHLNGRFQAGRYHGLGIACYVESTGHGPYEGARVAIKGSNNVAVYLGCTSLGQGHETAMAQICADGLGVPIESVSVFHGSTDLIPYSVGTFASRTTVMAGNALHLACQELKRKILLLASRYLGTAEANLEFTEGKIYRKGATGENPLLDLDQLVQLAGPASPHSLDEPGLEATAYFKMTRRTFTYGAHVAQVAVDPETGMVEVLRYLTVQDVGRCVNPLLVHGQTIGGAAQGIGGTILEELVYDENGQLLTTTFKDYLLPSSLDVPQIKSVVLEQAPSPLNPLGVKGAGEDGIIATGAALANAVAAALAPLGVEVRELPLSPDRVHGWIKEATTRSSSRT